MTKLKTGDDVAGPAAKDRAPLLELCGVTKAYGKVNSLEGVDFSVRRSEIVGLLGDNGAGKSTLIKIISGVVTPDNGTIRWEGNDVHIRDRSESAALGIETIFQDAALVDSMTIARNIFLGREPRNRVGLMDIARMRRISAGVLTSIVGIEGIDSPDKLVASLSGGQQQAVAIARAVYFKRKLLILDEPTSALAVRATQALWEYLRMLRADGLSSVLVTHNLHDAYQLCDRFVILSRGRVTFTGSTAETSVDDLIDRVSRATLGPDA